jgi:arsenate reductase-like glutaredoxin family protein
MSDSMRDLINIVESDDIEYTRTGSTKAKTAAGDFSKITATVSGRISEKFTKLATKFKQMQSLRDEANDEAKMHVEELFLAEDAVLTRYINTKSLAITMSKDQEESEVSTTSFDTSGFVADLYELLDDDLEPVIKKLIEVHTKTNVKIRAAQKGKISVKLGESSVLGKLAGFMRNLVLKVTARMQRYDSKLDAIKSKYKV